MKLLPSRRVLCTPYTRAPFHVMQSHIRKVHACLAVTCHLHFRQNDRDLLRATAVTRGWNGYGNKSQHRRHTPSTGLRHPSFNHAVFSYVIGSWKLSANKQFFVGAQTVVNLLQTTQIKQSFESTRNSLFSPAVEASQVYVGAWALGCFHIHISTQTFRRALTASVDSCVETKSA